MVIEGTLIRLQVDYLPGDRDPKPVWLWWSRTGAAPASVDRCWQAFLRRFDLEHTFRLLKQVLGWTTPKIRDPPQPTGPGPGRSSPPATPSSAWPSPLAADLRAAPGNGHARPAWARLTPARVRPAGS